MSTSYATEHALDVDFETARSLHRVVRAMHDGECPRCHLIVASTSMRRNGELFCPSCGFTITRQEEAAAVNAFGPVMERNLKVFEAWRERRK